MNINTHPEITRRTLGCVAILLHAHLPFVRQAHEEGTLEERWFFEAMTETYIPLLDVFQRLSQDQIPFRISLTMTPTLLALMEDPMMQLRYEHFLQRQIDLAAGEMLRLEEQSPPFRVAQMYWQRWSRWLRYYRVWERDIIAQYKYWSDQGHVEIMTCAATHAFLPLIMNESIAEAQIKCGIAEHTRHFGKRPSGIWLPECGYSPRLAPLLRRNGIHYYVVDSHTLQHAEPAPNYGTIYPLQVDEQLYAFARDLESSQQVWSAHEGYPGDADYREFYRDIGFDLGWDNEEEWNYIRPYLLPDGVRIDTGLKYYRITESGVHKAWYCEEQARRKAAEHAKHFIHSRTEQLMSYRNQYELPDQPPIIVSPYDAELFGHWWYEGPLWIETLFREHDAMRHEQEHPSFQFCSLHDYVQAHPQAVQADLPTSSWGRGGYAEVWLMERNDWIYKHLHQAELRLLHITWIHEALNDGASPQSERMMNQALRELMLAQSSDWAFMMDADTFTTYAANRTKEHVMRCHALLDMIENHAWDLEQLEQMEHDYPCFPTLVYRSLLPHRSQTQLPLATAAFPELKRILMLSWEFPPLVVGGLSRAVYELARHLTNQHCEVHVITRAVAGSPEYELMEHVHVHRVPIPSSETSIGFMDWVIQMNAAFIEQAEYVMLDLKLSFDYLHAHDWLVAAAAHELVQLYAMPLITTIHATEYGRNHGMLSSDLQQQIHHMEHELVRKSDHVIVCSQAMVQEIQLLFQLPLSRISMIPNGVIHPSPMSDQATAASTHQHTESPLPLQAYRRQLADDGELILFFIGRLVYEKGVHILLQALPYIIQQVKHVRLLIAGTGPMQSQLEALIHELQLEAHVQLLGFVQDEERDQLLQIADVCVFPSLYEPFGIVALEAMMMDTPVVVSDTGGLAEIITHKVDGFKVSPGDVQALAWHTIQLLQDRDLAAQFAREAKRKVLSQYNWNSIAESTLHVYEGVMVR